MSSFPASHRLRRGRYSEPNRIYLLTANTLHRQPIFLNWRVGRRVVEQFKQVQVQGLATSLAWVVMPDHFHWLISLEQGSLDNLMCRTKSLSTRAINQVTGQAGRRWQQGYHDHALRRDEDIKQVARYVIANPLRAGLVKRVGDYPLWDAIWV
ncbi:REP-associated tyrosine transposase [Pseudomonas fragi]|uniref:REP-associated tyrosine transposase n=1 Tax=Pseudomonas fragi TaxID=296 RepID=UPI00035F46C9|nr:transposase [Pseudomonas fragi]MDE4513744.1 transposase [Pseudomonas fragi]QPC36992.1 transposase [Pseudomonas fragi]SDU29223.1 REP element-mobilizing transposase RayT [Pseudomonas fragi]